MDIERAVVPDGGWGWMVVAAAAFINMFNQSILSVFGLLFGEHLKGMNEETTGAALIVNLNSLAYNFSGFIIGPVIKAFSSRSVAILGCLLTSAGLMVCSFSTELWHLIIGYSFMVGIGLGLLSTTTFISINTYFDKRKGRAVGISMAGTGIGQMILPQIVRILLDHYGFKTAVIVMSLFSLLGIFGSLLFKPLKPKIQPIYNNMKEVKLLLDIKEKQNFHVQVVKNDNIKSINLDQSKTKQKCAKLKQILKSILQKLAHSMDLELLKDPIFLSIIIGMALVYTATTNFSMLFPYFLQESIDLSRKDTALCMSFIAGADLISRILLPILTDKLNSPYRVTFLFGTIGMIVFRSLLAESEQLNILIILSICFGVMKSATVLNNNLTISDYCKPEKLASGLGLNMISKGVIIITFGQLLGWLRDYTGSYSLCLHAQNILLGLVVTFWLPELIYKYYKNRKLRLNSNSFDENDGHSIP